jgi:hypothetical protein
MASHARQVKVSWCSLVKLAISGERVMGEEVKSEEGVGFVVGRRG